MVYVISIFVLDCYFCTFCVMPPTEGITIIYVRFVVRMVLTLQKGVYKSSRTNFQTISMRHFNKTRNSQDHIDPVYTVDIAQF